MKKILITGSSGYIGSHLVKMLMNTMKYEVHCLDIKDPQTTANKYYRCDINRQFELDLSLIHI